MITLAGVLPEDIIDPVTTCGQLWDGGVFEAVDLDGKHKMITAVGVNTEIPAITPIKSGCGIYLDPRFFTVIGKAVDYLERHLLEVLVSPATAKYTITVTTSSSPDPIAPFTGTTVYPMDDIDAQYIVTVEAEGYETQTQVVVNDGDTIFRFALESSVPAFEVDGNSYNTLAEAIEAVPVGGTITLTADVVEPNNIVITKNMDIDFGTHTLTAQGDGIYVKNATVTLSGVTAGENGADANAVSAGNGAVVYIDGGHYYVFGDDATQMGNSTIYGLGNGVINISGGVFNTQYPGEDGNYYVVNKQNSSSAVINITGGTYVNYNPAVGDYGTNQPFLAEGYGVQHQGDEYIVVPSPYTVNGQVYNTFAEAVEAMPDNGVLTLNADVVEHNNISINKNMTLELGNNTIYALKDGPYIKDATVTITGDLGGDLGGIKAGITGGDVNAVSVGTGGVVNIESGDYYVYGDSTTKIGNSTIYAVGNGQINISGGTFATQYPGAGNNYYVVNKQNSSEATITITGGSYVNYNPTVGDYGTGQKFLADGYTVQQEGDVFTVIPEIV